MPKKSYSKQEREQIGRDLLSVGLEMLARRGLSQTRLQDILQAVGISKPFFYSTYYASLAELVIAIIGYEMELLLQAARDGAAMPGRTMEEIICGYLFQVTHGGGRRFFVMTQEEELWVYRHLNSEAFDVYQQGQAGFYAQLLALWRIPQEKCTPKELGNLLLSVVLIYNSASRSLPFFFPEELERTYRAQATALSRYLASLSGAADNSAQRTG